MPLVVSIPSLIVRPRPKDEDECGGFCPVIRIKTIKLPTSSLFQRNHELFELELTHPITISKNSSQNIEFPVVFITDLPALCIVTANSILYRYNLFYNVTIVPTNDSYPHITLFNYTTQPITVDWLSVSFQIVLAKNSTLFQSESYTKKIPHK
jgi:hypothetical protein